ncbi:hypothetical protein TSC_c07640 [Thermus scotoductus SA-01]|uniref:Uncharacterized protein n=1 Tax=Thermus scotoductus (strain ATCC 700910 / SA-01) TaxID=743525 RepID=E8PN41_THESS|nr:hypothetical protein TSC_c07640 [Thermus scotoductus SA-01]
MRFPDFLVKRFSHAPSLTKIPRVLGPGEGNGASLSRARPA